MPKAKYKYYFVPDVKDVWKCSANGTGTNWLLLNYGSSDKDRRAVGLKQLKETLSISMSSEQDIKNRNGIPIKREDVLALINHYQKELQYYAPPPHN